ncbi:MAG: 50S ribosomal protein L24 [Armatimonadetes bacterium]|nr:50S ribosomal protein L24 [Armatimonadota bacterium]
MHVKKNDTVRVLSGKDKGKTGKVLEVLPQKNRVVVDGVNVVKRHTKPRPPQIPQGGIIEKAMPIHASNVMVISPTDSKPTRVRRKRREGDDGKTRGVRVDKKGEEI